MHQPLCCLDLKVGGTLPAWEAHDSALVVEVVFVVVALCWFVGIGHTASQYLADIS